MPRNEYHRMCAWSCRGVASRWVMVALLTSLLAISAAAQESSSTELVPSGKGWGIPGHAPVIGLSTDTVTTGNGILYHGGPIIPGTVHIYFVWYGNWVNGPKTSDSPTTVELLQGLFAPHVLGGSPYEKINSTYGDATSNVTGNLQLKAAVTDSYSQGAKLTDQTLLAVISRAIASKALPLDVNGVYEVLSSSDVAETSGLCKTYCGFHGHTTIEGTDIKYVFAGNTDRCPGACEAQTVTPNGDSGADGMANILAHETEESITDPDLNAWFNNVATEDADLCQWKFGPLVGTLGKGAYNQTLGGKHWLIQMDWENAHGGGCVQKLGGPFYTQ
jgi:Phosphate-induced protein 1 conserved region